DLSSFVNFLARTDGYFVMTDGRRQLLQDLYKGLYNKEIQFIPVDTTSAWRYIHYSFEGVRWHIGVYKVKVL
ncbi:MAG TPA: hypothetical protein VG603_15880, partial [Chitinophagales bacterium]|nr:hypothetical protein [Chitinophagales bacterium]